ncbi:MAG: hypothetical protein HYU88_03705, partial [Chloroflexi bacterium]|nr:hypothetical protein [Chloroflexota bacterium]
MEVVAQPAHLARHRFEGLLLLPLPGPGWLVIAAGFVVLAQDFVWAERTLARIRRRLPQDSDG